MIDTPDLATVVAWLRASLHRGTPRPHPTARPAISDERRHQRDAEARAERLERDDTAPGQHPAPMHLDVLDLLDEAAAVAEWGDEATVGEFVHRAVAALGMLPDGQLLDALCPWCGGRTPRHPVGGGRTLRVRLIPDRKARGRRLPVIVCEGVNCDPPAAACSVDERWHGMPTWLQAEWDTLAPQLRPLPGSAGELADRQVRVMLDRACRCGQPIVAAPGRGGQQPGYCSDACRRAQRAENARRARGAA